MQVAPLYFFLIIIYFLAVLGLRCCAGFSLVVVSGGCSLLVVYGLPIVVASLLWSTGSRVLGLQ